MNVLILGGCGYIGTILTNDILNERITLYSKADLTINTENISIGESYKKLKTKLF